MVTINSAAGYGKSSELNSDHVLAAAVLAIEGLSTELDRTRAERDLLRERLSGKANLSEAA